MSIHNDSEQEDSLASACGSSQQVQDEQEDYEYDEDDRELLILYASQTGSAQDVAEYIGREAWRRHFKARVVDTRDFDKKELLDAPPTIIVTSTTGQGAFPTPLLPLWNFLIRSDLPPELLHNFTYTIFGLGDSSYPKFNWPARKLNNRLLQLGARELIEKGEGDDQHYMGIDGTLIPWLDSLWSTLLQHFPLPNHIPIIAPFVRPPARIRLRPLDTSYTYGNGDTHLPLPSLLRPAKLIKNERITSEKHFQDTRHVMLEFDEDLNYEAGDILGLQSENLPEDVDRFLKLMKWENVADTIYAIEPAKGGFSLPPHWSKTATVRQLLTKQLDIFSVPRRSFFEWLSYFTESELETEKLQEFCTADGQEDMYDYAHRPRRTIFEVLSEFKSAKIPLEYITDIFPEIRPRQFSIASSSLINPRRVELLVAIVKYKTKLHEPRKGVATSWLSTLTPGSAVYADIEVGSMRLPSNPSTPIILIGPGTGIAPFRAFVQQSMTESPKREILVFFGCRSGEKDYYFKDEWEKYQAEKGGNFKMIVAASRDQENKKYVQHKIVEEAKRVWELVDRKQAVIYISGSSGSMPKAVQKAFREVFRQEGNLDEAGADAYFARLEGDGRYHEETWS